MHLNKYSRCNKQTTFSRQNISRLMLLSLYRDSRIDYNHSLYHGLIVVLVAIMLILEKIW